MREVWLVEGGEYSDRYVHAVCSSYEQACGVAVMNGLYESGTVEMWEEEDEIPPFKLLYSCTVRTGRDSVRPLDVEVSTSPIAVDAPMPEPKIILSRPEYRNVWANALNYATAEDAETAARSAYEARVSLR